MCNVMFTSMFKSVCKLLQKTDTVRIITNNFSNQDSSFLNVPSLNADNFMLIEITCHNKNTEVIYVNFFCFGENCQKFLLRNSPEISINSSLKTLIDTHLPNE